MDKKKFGQVLFCLPYLPIQKVWTFWNKSLSLNSYFPNFDGRLNAHFFGILCQYDQLCRNSTSLVVIVICLMTKWDAFKKIKKSSPTHSQNILPSQYFISMDIHIWPTYLKSFCPNFFFEKVCLKNTLPTYSLTYVKTFVVFFLGPFP